MSQSQARRKRRMGNRPDNRGDYSRFRMIFETPEVEVYAHPCKKTKVFVVNKEKINGDI